MKKNNFRYIKLKWVKSRNKLYALLRSDRSREILTFMFFLVISFIFWVLQSLNEDVESSFSLNVKYVNVPEKVVFTNKLPDEIDVRFIEMMPMCDSSGFGPEAYIPFTRVLEALPEAVPAAKDGGVAKLFHLPGALGNIGLISPVSAHFCGECNRIRLTADGKVKPCLHSNAEYPLKGLDFDGMKAQLEAAIFGKPQWHGDLDVAHKSGAGRNMNQIGG